MEIASLEIFKRSVTIETDAPEPFESAAPYIIRLNGEEVMRSRRNVVTIDGLEPDTDYRISVGEGEEIRFRTKKESVLLNVRDFGAAGDGRTKDTAYLQAAIYACPKDGTVYVPRGTYLVTPLFLKSNITLWLDEEAVLLGETEEAQYPVLPGMAEGTDEKSEYNVASWEGNPLASRASLLTGIDVENIDIVGRGVIDGNAQNAAWWIDVKKRKRIFRPNVVFFCRGSNIRMQGLTIRNSPGWTVHPYYSQRLRFVDLTIQNPPDSPNTDGFDPESCRDLLLLGTVISVGDDCVAIKSGKYYMAQYHWRRCEQLVIRNCLMERGHGSVTIGSEVAGGVCDVLVEKCRFEGTDRGIRFKTRRGRGSRSVLEDIRFSNIKMADVHMPLTVNMFYYCDPDGHSDYVQNRAAMPVDEGTPVIRKISAEKMQCTGVRASFICAYGLPESPIGEIRVEDADVTFAPPSRRPAELPLMMDDLPEMTGKSFFLRNVEKVVLSRVTVRGSDDREPDLKGVGSEEISALQYQ